MEEGTQKSLLLLTFSSSESDSNVHFMMRQLFKTHDELLEHMDTFETFETVETQDTHGSVDTVCVKEYQSNVCRTRSK